MYLAKSDNAICVPGNAFATSAFASAAVVSVGAEDGVLLPRTGFVSDASAGGASAGKVNLI